MANIPSSSKVMKKMSLLLRIIEYRLADQTALKQTAERDAEMTARLLFF